MDSSKVHTIEFGKTTIWENISIPWILNFFASDVVLCVGEVVLTVRTGMHFKFDSGKLSFFKDLCLLCIIIRERCRRRTDRTIHYKLG